MRITRRALVVGVVGVVGVAGLGGASSALGAQVGMIYQRPYGTPFWGDVVKFIAAPGERNDVTVTSSSDGATVTLVDNGANFSLLPPSGMLPCVSLGHRAICATTLARLVALGPPATDPVVLHRTELNLGDGDDRATVPAGSGPRAVIIEGGAGNDVYHVDGGTETDMSDFPSGNDTYVITGGKFAFVQDGIGNDTIDASAAPGHTFVDLFGGATGTANINLRNGHGGDEVDCTSVTETIVADASDTLLPSAGPCDSVHLGP
jgi:hypothetical protein